MWTPSSSSVQHLRTPSPPRSRSWHLVLCPAPLAQLMMMPLIQAGWPIIAHPPRPKRYLVVYHAPRNPLGLLWTPRNRVPLPRMAGSPRTLWPPIRGTARWSRSGGRERQRGREAARQRAQLLSFSRPRLVWSRQGRAGPVHANGESTASQGGLTREMEKFFCG